MGKKKIKLPPRQIPTASSMKFLVGGCLLTKRPLVASPNPKAKMGRKI